LDRKPSLDFDRLAEEKFKEQEIEQSFTTAKKTKKIDSTSLANSLIHTEIKGPIKANQRPTLQQRNFQDFQMNLAPGPSPLIPHAGMLNKFSKKEGETKAVIREFDDNNPNAIFDFGQ
jgi:hypothetical protein